MEALLNANKVFNRNFDVTVELWVGPQGRVAQVQLVGSSGDPVVDAALRDEVRTRLILPPPSKDMPMPIKLGIRPL
jgi:TonB family protein